MPENISIKVWKNWLDSIEWMGSDDEKGMFLLKIMRYAFYGIEPEIERHEGQTWELLKTSIDAMLKDAENGSRGGRPKKDKGDSKQSDKGHQESPAKTPIKTHSETPSKTPNENPSQKGSFIELELEREYELELEPEREREIYAPENAQSFPLQCLEVFNEIMGTAYGGLPSDATRTLNANSERYTVDDVRDMVRFKRGEWYGTEFQSNLTPKTLFSRDHFEQYIHQSKMPKPKPKDAGGEIDADLEQYIAALSMPAT